MKSSAAHFLIAATATVVLVVPPGGRALAEDITAVVAPGVEAERLGTGMRFTEGPVWIPAEKKLVFSDIPASLQMQWTEDGGVTELRKVEATNGNLLDLDGNLLSCQHAGRNVVRWKDDGTAEVLADSWEGRKLNSPNDLAIRSDGSIWFTDPSYGLGDRPGEIDGKNVYRLAPDGTVTLVYDGFDMPNGIAFSPDEKRVYIADTGRVGTVRAFDVREDGTGIVPEPVFELDIRCDGMCIDVDGRLYTTSRGGLHVFDASGSKLGIIPVPEHPANVCFGGDDYRTLFVTARTSLYAVPAKVAGAKPPGAKW